MEDNFVDYNIRHGLDKLWKWKLWIIGACVLAGVISIAVSLKKKDEFKSKAAFVPPAFSSLSTMTFGNGVSYRGFYSADEEDIDRTIDYLTSPAVVDSVAELFDLYNHYGIDMEDDKRDKKFYQTFYGKIDIDFSGNSTVVVEAWDENPEYSFNIAKTYIDIANKYFEDISQRREGLKATESALRSMEDERQLILDSLSYLRSEYGIYRIDNAGEAITKILADRMRNNPNFGEFYDVAKTMETYLSTLELRYGDLQREFMTRKLNLEQYPRLIWVTQYPTQPTFKDRPKRSIIVILSVLATFVLTCFLVVVLDRK